MAKQIDFKEYTRIRDIVQKRIKRAVKAGLAPMVHVPTVKEIRAGIVDPGEALRALKGYYSSGSKVKTIRQTGLVPEFKSFPTLPEVNRKLTDEEKRERRRIQSKRQRQIKKIKQGFDDDLGEYKVNTFKSAMTLYNRFKSAGFDLGFNPYAMTPTQARQFTEYISYRFAQADFKRKYLIEDFIEDYGELMRQGYKPDQIINDFNLFLENRYHLDKNRLSMEGLTEKESLRYWAEFKGLRGST